MKSDDDSKVIYLDNGDKLHVRIFFDDHGEPYLWGCITDNDRFKEAYFPKELVAISQMPENFARYRAMALRQRNYELVRNMDNFMEMVGPNAEHRPTLEELPPQEQEMAILLYQEAIELKTSSAEFSRAMAKYEVAQRVDELPPVSEDDLARLMAKHFPTPKATENTLPHFPFGNGSQNLLSAMLGQAAE